VVEEETDSVALLDAPDELMKRRHCPVGQRAEKWQEEEIDEDKIQARQPKLVAR